MEKFVSFINGEILWGLPMLVLFIGVGLLYTGITRGIQLRGFVSMFRETLFSGNNNTKSGNLSPFQTLTASLATTLGTGNIVAVGAAVALGGAGAVFWMWVSAFIGMATAYGETVLGMKFRRKSKDGSFDGSPCYYIKDGLKKPKLAGFYAISCILASFGMGSMAQVSAAAASMEKSFNTPPIVVGIVSAVIVGSVIFGGIKRFGAIMEKLIPVLSAVYIIGCAAVIIINISEIPAAFSLIFKQAFNIKSIGFGGGAGILTAMSWGFKRGIFSNEAGLGSSVMIHSSTSQNNAHNQGLWAMLQVFLDTIVMCTLTALCVIVTGAQGSGLSEENIAVFAFSSAFGGYAGAFVSIAVFFFALCTAAGWSVFGVKCSVYLFGQKSRKPYLILFIMATFGGAVIQSGLVWGLSDLFNGLMAVPNLIAMLFLANHVKNNNQPFT